MLYVSGSGNDSWSGRFASPDAKTNDGPFATLERARRELRKLKRWGKTIGPATVYIREGLYRLEKPFNLSKPDSGTRDAPVIYRPYNNERVIVSGGRVPTNCKPYNKNLQQCSLAGLAIDRLSDLVDYSRFLGNAPPFEVFVGGQRMDLARWPNRNPSKPEIYQWAYVAPPSDKKDKVRFHYFGTRPDRWTDISNAQVHIWPGNDWYDQYRGIKSVDKHAREITLSSPTSYGIQPGRRFYVRNLFEELDAPGEWFFDKKSSSLFYYPPDLKLPVLPEISYLENAITLDRADHVRFEGIVFEQTRHSAIIIKSGRANAVNRCEIRNVGGYGIEILGGKNNRAHGNTIHDTGRGGILLHGGDRKTLQAAANVADNNHIYGIGKIIKTYQAAIGITGVGNHAAHNLIHDIPHLAIEVIGNDHVVEFNEIHDVCTESSDCGAIYTGRDWTFHGNELRYNLIHDIYGYGLHSLDSDKGIVRYRSPHGTRGIYLYDMASGFRVYGNVMYRAGEKAIQLSGGRHNTIENNILVDSKHAIWLVALSASEKLQQRMRDRLHAVPYQGERWRKHFPDLARAMRNPLWPEHNNITNNIIVAGAVRYIVPKDAATIDRNLYWNGNKQPVIEARFLDSGENVAMRWQEWIKTGFDAHSLIAAPRFLDAGNNNFVLEPDSPAFRLGFREIPYSEIGLQIPPRELSVFVEPGNRATSREVIYTLDVRDEK